MNQKSMPYKWTVRGHAIEIIIDNYNILHQLWDECFDAKLIPDSKARVVSRQACEIIKVIQLFSLVLRLTEEPNTD